MIDPIKIQVEVKLSDETLATIKNCIIAVASAIMTSNIGAAATVQAVSETIDGCRDIVSGAQSEVKTPAEESVDTKPEAAPQAESEPSADMPDFTKEITDDDMAAATRKAVAGVKSRGENPTFIRTNIFSKFNISESKACPKERRQELLDELKKLW